MSIQSLFATGVRSAAVAGCIASIAIAGYASADETCQSPYLPKITGQEDFVYIWTLGIEGLGDGSDNVWSPELGIYGGGENCINFIPIEHNKSYSDY